MGNGRRRYEKDKERREKIELKRGGWVEVMKQRSMETYLVLNFN